MQINGISNVQAFTGAEKKVNKKAAIAAGVVGAAAVGTTVAFALKGKKLAGEEAGKGLKAIGGFIAEGAKHYWGKVASFATETWGKITSKFSKAEKVAQEVAE